MLLRKGSDQRGIAGLPFEPIEGDLDDKAALRRGLQGCDWCFHVAASYHLWLPDYAPMYQANVEGTRHIIEAASAAGCQRIVYTSTVGCIKTSKWEEGRWKPSDETQRASLDLMTNDYKRSKFMAEDLALDFVKKGSPIVLVLPAAPVGPRDVKPTPTGQFVLDVLNRAMPAYLETGLNYVHVRDVAMGHILAAEKGRIGERYILGHTEGNWTMKQALDVLAEITGIPAPSFRVPYGVALAAAHVNELMARFTGKPPKAPLGGVRMAKYTMFFDPSKAVHELGMPQTSPKVALQEAVEWFRANGYAKK